MVIHLGHASPRASSDLPGSHASRVSSPRGRTAPLFGLAPGGVYPATSVASGAVRSYRTISPLPFRLAHSSRGRPKHEREDWRYIFCGTFRRLTPPRRYLAPCSAEPGLSSIRGEIHRRTATTQSALQAVCARRAAHARGSEHRPCERPLLRGLLRGQALVVRRLSFESPPFRDGLPFPTGTTLTFGHSHRVPAQGQALQRTPELHAMWFEPGYQAHQRPSSPQAKSAL
ncbi:MAG: hypothetical protein ACI8PT_000389 [Gammaproteobacteria bacterium]|jgi:hypothetical protein